MEEEDVPLVVLQRYAGHWEIGLHPTSRVVRANCGHLSWLSPQGEGMAAVNYTVCTECFAASWVPPDEELRTVPGAVEALGELWGSEVAAEVREQIRRWGISEVE